MLLGRETRHNLQRDLIELRKALSEKIIAIHELREKARSHAAELFELKEIKENQEYLSPKLIEEIKHDPRIAEINDEAKNVASPEKVKALTELFTQAEELSTAIFSDGIITLHTQLLDGLRTLLVQAIKDILNNYYFTKHAESDKKIASILNKAKSKRSLWLDEFLFSNTDEAKQISEHIKEVKKQVETLFAQNQKIPNLLHPQIICFNDQANRAELYFSKELDIMPLADLMECANQVMWATEYAGIIDCHNILAGLHEKPVGDKTFFDYMRCEKWLTGYGYYYLTIVPEAKNLIEQLMQQEKEGFLKYRNAIDALKASAATELLTAESNLVAVKKFALRIKELRTELVEHILAVALINKKENKKFQHEEKAVVIEVPLKPQTENIENSEEQKPADPVAAPPGEVVTMSQTELTEQLFKILQSVLSDDNVKNFWSKLVYQTGIFWNWRIAVDGKNYSVPTGISYARAELDKFSEEKHNMVEVVTKTCQALRNRMNGEKKFSTTLYYAVGQLIDGDKLVITEEKLITLRKEFMRNGILADDPTAKPTKHLSRTGSNDV